MLLLGWFSLAHIPNGESWTINNTHPVEYMYLYMFSTCIYTGCVLFIVQLSQNGKKSGYFLVSPSDLRKCFCSFQLGKVGFGKSKMDRQSGT